MLGILSHEEYNTLKELTKTICWMVKEELAKKELELYDIKLEFGRDAQGNVLLADEISPDTCRLWDVETNQHLDKDVFRRGLGDLTEVYKIILSRLGGQA